MVMVQERQGFEHLRNNNAHIKLVKRVIDRNSSMNVWSDSSINTKRKQRRPVKFHTSGYAYPWIELGVLPRVMR